MNCRECKFISPEDDGNPPDARYFWYECTTTGYDNLKSFPFQNTKCRKFQPSGHYLKPNLIERLRDLLPDK